MQNYKSGSLPRYDIKYHTVWISKYGKPIMAGTVAERLRELLRQTCLQNEVIILKGHVSKDHIHILVSCSPGLAVSKLAQKLKGASFHKVFEEFAHLRKQYWRQHLWPRGYFAATIGIITENIIKDYIEHPDSETPDDDFRIGS